MSFKIFSWMSETEVFYIYFIDFGKSVHIILPLYFTEYFFS